MSFSVSKVRSIEIGKAVSHLRCVWTNPIDPLKYATLGKPASLGDNSKASTRVLSLCSQNSQKIKRIRESSDILAHSTAYDRAKRANRCRISWTGLKDTVNRVDCAPTGIVGKKSSTEMALTHIGTVKDAERSAAPKMRNHSKRRKSQPWIARPPAR